MSRRRSVVWSVAAATLVGLLLREGAVFFFEARKPAGEQFFFGDSESYWTLGRAIAEGRPYEFGPDGAKVFRTPGYPALLSLLHRVGGSAATPAAAAHLSAVLGAAAIVLAYLLARRLFSPGVGVLAAWLVAVSPDAVATSGVALSEAPFTVLLLLQWIVLFGRGARPPGVVRAAVVGLLAGCATLVRPSWLLFWPAASAAVLLLAWRLPSVRKYVAPVLIIAAASAGPLIPWWIRNYQAVGRFVPTTLQVGASLYDGLRPDADGASDMRFVDDFRAELRAKEAVASQAPAAPWEVRLDQAMRDAAVAWAREHPGRVLQLAGVKLVRMWNVRPNEASLRGRWIDWACIAFTLPTFLLAIVSVLLPNKKLWTAVMLAAPAAYFTALHMIFVAGVRYRAPVAPFVLILTAAAVIYFLRGGARRTETPPPRKA